MLAYILTILLGEGPIVQLMENLMLSGVSGVCSD